MRGGRLCTDADDLSSTIHIPFVLCHAQAYTHLPSRKRQWSTERHGIRLSGLRRPEGSTGRLARLRSVRTGYLKSE